MAHHALEVHAAATDPQAPDRIDGRRAGFTMVEVIIAVIVLAVGVLGLAGTTAYIVRQVTLADIMTERAAALQTAIERVQAMDFDTLDTGSDSVGIYGVRWTSAFAGSQLKEVTIITNGPGLAQGSAFPMLSRQVADTFVFKVIRP